MSKNTIFKLKKTIKYFHIKVGIFLFYLTIDFQTLKTLKFELIRDPSNRLAPTGITFVLF